MPENAPHDADPVPPGGASRPDLPVLAVLCNSLPPYELNLYRLLAAGLPVRLQTLMTNVDGSRSWELEGAPEIDLTDLSDGDPIARLSSPRDQLREWRRGGRVVRTLRAAGARCVVVNGYNDLGRLRAIFWCWRRGVPCYLRSDSNLLDEAGKPAWKLLAKRVFLALLLRVLSGSLVVGERGRAYWRHYGEREERIYFVPYTPDYGLLESLTEDEVRHAAERHGIDRGRRRLVFSGRLIPVKRVDLLIDAFARLAAERPEWDLLVLGDGELRDELQRRVPEGLRDRVTWTGFLAEQRDVSRLYRLSDVLVLPSDKEPWALVVNEAVAAGLAVVASDVVGAAAALVEPGRNGEVFPRGDLGALTDALRRVTAPKRIDANRAASPGVLAAWRAAADPVEGMRRALLQAGVID